MPKLTKCSYQILLQYTSIKECLGRFQELEKEACTASSKMVPVQLLFLKWGQEDLGSTRYFVRVLVSGGKTCVKAKVKQKLIFLMMNAALVYTSFVLGRPWILRPSQECAGVPKLAPLTISVVNSLNPALHWSLCEPGKLIHLRKQWQNTSRSYAAYFHTEKVLTKWSWVIFCMCEKFKRLLSLFNVAQWTPASQKIQVRKGWDFGFLAVIIDNLQWINVAKSHKEKKQNKKNVIRLKNCRKQCIHLNILYFYANLAIGIVMVSAHFQLVYETAILQTAMLRLPPPLTDWLMSYPITR